MFDELKPATVVIFGASGDLTRRKLAPAPHTLGYEGFLPATSQVRGAARSPLPDRAFRDSLVGGVQEHSRARPGACSQSSTFEDHISYLPATNT